MTDFGADGVVQHNLVWNQLGETAFHGAFAYKNALCWWGRDGSFEQV